MLMNASRHNNFEPHSNPPGFIGTCEYYLVVPLSRSPSRKIFSSHEDKCKLPGRCPDGSLYDQGYLWSQAQIILNSNIQR